METSATADGFYFSVRSTRPVLLRRVRVQLLDGTAPTTVRVAVRRDGAAKRPQAAFLDEKVEWELLEAQALPAPFVPDKGLVYAKDDVPAFSAGGGADDVVEGGRADDVEGDGGWEFVPDEAAWREELAEFIRRRGDHFMSC